MQNELVSILTPSFNSAPFIVAAIASVQAQTHTNWELIIIDDASLDETVAIVKALAQMIVVFNVLYCQKIKEQV